MAPSSAPFVPSAGRVPIQFLRPASADPRWNAKAFVGEVVPFTATVYLEGHDEVGAVLEITTPDGHTATHRMSSMGPGTDRWTVSLLMHDTGLVHWRVIGLCDDWATWLHTADIKLAAGIDESVTREIGARLCDRASTADATPARSAAVRKELTALAKLLRNPKTASETALEAAHSPTLTSEFWERPLATLMSESPAQTLKVERSRAGVGSWYEFFPRSEGAVRAADGSWTSGTFVTAQRRLAEVAQMGFDVVYLPPIHPIGLTHRKGPNNTLVAGPNDPGSPWAVGSAEGGHDAVHPELGTLDDFISFVAAARSLDIEIALDLALQASPDHPWVTAHPEWFTELPDGTIAYAENPPKKYQDIYPINFDRDPEGIRAEVLRIVRHWIAAGVRIFRVDNPHTKPLAFWEWLIATVNDEFPDVVFLAEAFTRPAMMQALAMAGFQQSYSYFTWRNTKAELSEFLTEISRESCDTYRPNLWVNTPDILTPYLQYGGRAAFTVRATIAATAAPSWGMYAGFELYESVARPGADEAIDNEKYEFKPRDFAAAEQAGASLALYIGTLNRIRREHPALGQLRNLELLHTEDDAVLAYAKHLDAEFTGTGAADTVIVVVNTDPQSVRETKVQVDVTRFGLPAGPFQVRDLVTGHTWTWGESNYVRLDSFEQPAHVLTVEPLPEAKR
ncbi:MAG TPA: maltotransferase domain-containing protein [Microbacteriaceae bacterium]|nr:maltotransferase domain-containing protein [Microbacteriaceae bacterium]